MIRQKYTVKALAFLLVLLLVNGSLSYAAVAADAVDASAKAITHVGQPAENLVTLKLNNSKDHFFRITPNPQSFDFNEAAGKAFVVPLGCNLIITDVYYVSVIRHDNSSSNIDIWVTAEDANSNKDTMYYRYPHYVDYGDNVRGIELCEHFTTGFVIGPGCKVVSATDATHFFLYGYLTGTATTLYVPGQAPAPIDIAAPTSQSSIGQQTTTSNSASTASETDSWAGRWMTSLEALGEMELSLQGNSIIGTIGNGKYLVSGTISGRELTAVWQEPETKFKGNLILTLSEDGKSFSGKWNSSLSLTWQTLSGKRQQ